MKHLLALLVIFSTPSFAETSEEEAIVQAMVKSGRAVVYKTSEQCSYRYSKRNDLTSHLGKPERYGVPRCVRQVRLPHKVLDEVKTMEASELTNESDYDQRVTKLYVFEQDSFSPSGIEHHHLEELTRAFGVAQENIATLRAGIYKVGRKGFGEFDEVFVGDDFVEKSKAASYLRKKFMGQTFLHIKMRESVELYPGGGFRVDFNFFISEKHIIFVKRSWHDA